MEIADIVWVTTAAAFVILMQGGFCMLESGMVRSKNSINVAIKNISDFCLSGALFWAIGFGLMFSDIERGFTTDYFFYNNDHDGSMMAFFLFQVVFCGTAATILSGAIAERTRFIAYLACSAIVALVIYPIFGRWAWNGLFEGEATGWLNQQGFVDFAGSSVVHSTGGWVALAAVLIIGPRIGRFNKDLPQIQGWNIPMATLGVFLLWFGWFGFNGGSTLRLDERIPVILVNTNLAGMFGGLTGLLVSYLRLGRPDVGHALNGTLAGLVSITAGCHAFSPADAVITGIVGGCVYHLGTTLLERLEIDDVVGAVSVHGFCGAWGTLAVAIFGNPELLGTGLSMFEQLRVQITGIVVCFVWTFGVSYILLTLVNRIMPLRVSKQFEIDGLNVSEHDSSTEVLDLLHAMREHEASSDFSIRVPEEPHTEVGQIAHGYNQVIVRVEKEINRNERLLTNILPSDVAARLKDGESTIVDSFNDVAILFIDIVDFTKLSAPMAPSDLVSFLNDIFSGFDTAVDKYSLEKIKTIGDAYMAVAGLPKPTGNPGQVIAHLALDIVEYLDEFNKQSKHPPIKLRIGINSGPVTAGIIGQRRFVYDLWGNAVNVANRMESSCLPGRIQLTSNTVAMLDRDEFHLEQRGSIDIKGIGPMETYFLNGRSKMLVLSTNK